MDCYHCEGFILFYVFVYLQCWGLWLSERRSRRGNLWYRLKESHLKWGWLTQDGSTQPAWNGRNEKKEKSLLDVLNHFTLQPAKGLDGVRDRTRCQVKMSYQKHTCPQTSSNLHMGRAFCCSKTVYWKTTVGKSLTFYTYYLLKQGMTRCLMWWHHIQSSFDFVMHLMFRYLK